MKYYDAFISYGRADSKNFATELNQKLTEAGLNIWFDQKDIPLAVDFQEQINDGIEKAHNFLFIIAPHSVNSQYCLKEIELAIKLNKRIIPLLHVEEISQETWQERNPNKTEDDWQEYQQKGLHSHFPNMHPTIRKLNWVYFRDQDDFSTAFTGLVTAINKHENYVEQHTNFLLQALEWLRNQQQTNYLLVGEERGKAENWLKQRFTDEQPPCIPTDLHCEFICESTKNAQNLLTQVFLASSDKDDEIKEKIRKTLMRESLTVWTNKIDIKTGSSFQKAINQGIEGADNFVYLMSMDSLKSEYCQQELNQALANNKRIIPLLIQEIDLDLIPFQLQKLQFIDFTKSEDEQEYEFSADKLLGELKQEPSYYEKHKILLVKARKWQNQNYNPSLLLRGYNLQLFEAWLKVAKQREDYPPLHLQEEFITASLNKPEEYSLEVFISYSRTNSDLARKLNDALQELGKTTWFDQESIATATDFQKEIYRGIENSDNFLFIISPKSINSPYCADEVEYAQKLNKRFVTILHTPLSTDDQQKLPPALASVQWLDFNQHQAEFYVNFNELVRTLDTDREYVRNHTKWSQRALEWQEKDKNPDLLLRGSEFSVAEKWLKTAETENKKPTATDLQRELIAQSLAAIEAEKKQKHLQILKLRSLLVIASVALVASIVAIIFGWIQLNKSERNRQTLERNELSLSESLNKYSLSLLNEGKDLDAFIQAIKSGKILQNQNKSEPERLTALQAVIFRGRERNRLEKHNSSVNSLGFSSDGKILASGGLDNIIKLWDIETGKEIRSFQGHKKAVNSLSFSSDGKILASGSEDNTIKLWDIETGKEIFSFQGHNKNVNTISFSFNSKILASSGADNIIKLWNLETGKEIFSLQGHKKAVNSIAFNSDGKILASGSADNTIKLWNLETGKEIFSLQGHNKDVNTLSFRADGKILASGSADKTIKLWNLETRKEILSFQGHNKAVNTLSFRADAKILASGSADKTIKLWNVETGKEIFSLQGHMSDIHSLSFSPDGKTLASSTKHNKIIKIWDIEIGKNIRSLNEHTSDVFSISFSSDGKTLASGSKDKTIKLWNIETGKQIYSLTGHDSFIWQVNFSSDGKTLASGSEDNTIKLWNVETGREIHSLTGHHQPVYSVSFSPDAKTLASGGGDNTINLWNVETGKKIGSLIGHTKNVFSVSFSPDGKTLASGSWDKTIKLWNVETGKEIHSLTGHSNYVHSISFSPNGKTLASGSKDKTIKIWNVATGKEIRSLIGHTSDVYSVSFSPNGQTLVSSGADNTIKVWNVETGKEIRSLIGHTSDVYSVSFSPNGQTLASGSADTTIKFWNFDFPNLDTLMERSCDWVRNYLENNPNVSDDDKHLCDHRNGKM